MNAEQYFESIEKAVREHYRFAEMAKAKGIDPVSKVETPIAMTLAEKAVGLISTVYPQLDHKIVERILELEKQYGQLDTAVSFKIAEEISREKFCKFESLLQAIDAGIRVGFSYITLGVVSSPIEGFTGIRLGRTKEGKEYFIASFSGPIRSAGTTASCVVLMLIDYLRETFGYAKFDPDETEVKRYVTENYDYHERVNNLQYLPSPDEITFLAKNLPIQIDGDPTEDREVSNYKDLKRVETNFIRGGMCLIFSEGLAQKAQKGLRLLKGVQEKGFVATGWNYLDEYIEKFKKKAKGGGGDNVPTYIKDLVAGRPVYGHPSKKGGFRFRYGRGRTSGFSATSVHPATMALTDSFLSFGNQLKIEKPTKGCAVSVTDEVDGPIVKLRDGSVRRVNDFNGALALYKDVSEIIHLGDILISFGDVANRNYELLKPGYVEERWELQLEKAAAPEKINLDKFNVSFEKAKEISIKYKIPMHPRYIYYWSELDYTAFISLVDWLSAGRVAEDKLILPYTHVDRERYAKGKRALELIGCEHNVFIENVILTKEDSAGLLYNLGIEISGNYEEQIMAIRPKIVEEKPILELVNSISLAVVKDKSGAYVGARMGRPEKSKLRKLIGSPHVMFPVGEGGRLRSFQSAVENGFVTAEFPIFYCDACKRETVYPACETCNGMCKRYLYSKDEDKCYIGSHPDGKELQEYREKSIDIRHYFDLARKQLGLRNEDFPIVKGVRGTMNKDHSCEYLGKGLLRSKYNLNVNKDGTIRYDMTEMAITHFKPKEIGTSVAKLKELGYEKDMNGNPLENDEQVLELYPHDVILPACPETLDEKADDVFLNITHFEDEELEKIYGLPKFFNAKTTEDLMGHLVVCIAPHICTATVGRLIGFSKTQALLASPFMHAAMRRDCDGDEAAAILLMDMLLNFSRKFLPAHRGGTQDAPLVLNIRIRAGDVDDQILDLETGKYPLELYELAEQGKHSSEMKTIDNVKKRLKEGKDPFTNIGFTHGCKDFNNTIINSSYKILPSMHEKVERMMGLCTKIRAVDTTDVARLMIERHFIRDTRGNLRKFSMQVFRCVGCNDKYRRPPLGGKCTKCGGRLIFTISEGSILKYMQPALMLAREHKVSAYLTESLELTEMYIQSIFGKEKEKQESISKWF